MLFSVGGYFIQYNVFKHFVIPVKKKKKNRRNILILRFSNLNCFIIKEIAVSFFLLENLNFPINSNGTINISIPFPVVTFMI